MLQTKRRSASLGILAIALAPWLAGCGADHGPAGTDASQDASLGADISARGDQDAQLTDVSAAGVADVQLDTGTSSVPAWPRCPGHLALDGSLASKAAVLDAAVRARHLPDGLLRTIQVDEAGDFVSAHHVPSTGLWTAIYLASQALRYDVTGDPEALENVATVAAGLHDLTEVTGRPGLYGRAYQRPGDSYASPVSADTPTWVASPAPGYEGWLFNEEVSKDSMDGVVFGYGVALELLGDLEVTDIVRADLVEFVRAFVADGLQIISHEGVVTEHGRLYYSAFDDFPGFNALLTLAWVGAAVDAGADDLRPIFDDCLLRLGGGADCPAFDSLDLGSYVDVIEDALGLYIGDCKTSYDNIDMVFQAAWTLLRREHRPALRDRLLAVLRTGIWQPSEPEVAPAVHRSTHSLYTYLYGGLAQPGPDDGAFAAALADAMCTLHALPADRRDVAVTAGAAEGVCTNRSGRLNAAEPIPVAERYFDNYLWRLDPYEIPEAHEAIDGLVHSPEDFLVAYWLGRHLGYVSPDE